MGGQIRERGESIDYPNWSDKLSHKPDDLLRVTVASYERQEPDGIYYEAVFS